MNSVENCRNTTGACRIPKVGTSINKRIDEMNRNNIYILYSVSDSDVGRLSSDLKAE